MYLDPDFRPKPPKDKPYCCRCQKAIKDTAKAVRVSVDWDTWETKLGGDLLLGPDCFKIISKGI